jgi:hypothetical protein
MLNMQIKEGKLILQLIIGCSNNFDRASQHFLLKKAFLELTKD